MYVLRNSFHALSVVLTPEEKAKALLNYLIAIDRVLVPNKNARQDTMLYRGGGFRCNLQMSASVFNVLEQCYPPERRYTVNSMAEVIELALDELSNDAASMRDPEWWLPGKGAGRLPGTMNADTAKSWADAFDEAAKRAGNRLRNESSAGDTQQYGF